MASLVVNERGVDDLARQAGALETVTAVPEGSRPAERMHVYAAGYPARITEALAETFPAVAHVVGDGAFAALARRFAAVTPFASYSLNDAGADLPRFLHGDLLTERLAFLPDLAQLEWQVARAFHALDETPLVPSAFAPWTMEQWERAVLQFQPWLSVVRSEWPIREIWESRETPVAAIDIDLRNRPDRVLVRRTGFEVTCESVSEDEADALAALIAGSTLGEVVARLANHGGDPAGVSAWFGRWMTLRLVKSVTSD